jgi:Aspartyl protease
MALGKVRAICVTFCFLMLAAQADAKGKEKLDPNELSMNVVGGYLIVVKARIGDHHDLNFLLDTGATTSAIDRRLAEHLNLPTRSSGMVSFDKTVQVQWCVLPELVYGPERAVNTKVVVEDLRYLRAGGAVVEGVIGWDLLRRNSFRLDFASKRVVFGAMPAAGRRSPRRPAASS